MPPCGLVEQRIYGTKLQWIRKTSGIERRVAAAQRCVAKSRADFEAWGKTLGSLRCTITKASKLQRALNSRSARK